MLETHYHYKVMLQTGEWSHFLIYVCLAWALMLPRALGGGIFYSFRPAQPIQLSLRYIASLILAISVLYAGAYYRVLGQLDSLDIAFVLMVFILIIAPPIRRRIVRFSFSWTFYANHVKLVEQTNSVEEQSMIALMTIYNEDPEKLARRAKSIRQCLEAAPGDFVFMAIVDGYGNQTNNYGDTLPIAVEYCDVVMTSTAQKKRANLEALGLQAYEMGLIQTGEEIIHLIDSDTTPQDDLVAIELNRPFTDPAVGGVTTAQYIDNPKTFWQHVMQIFETIRNFGSQAFMSLFGSVGCLPGRWYAVRAQYFTREMLHDLNTHSFSWFGYARHISKAGDDRHITEAVLKAGGKTMLAPDAVVYTDTPPHFTEMRKMVTRWARSSNGYTFRAGWLFKPAHWPTAFVYWGNIVLAFGTIYIAKFYLIYQIVMGNRDILLFEALVYLVLSMMLTMTFRFIPVWIRNWRYLGYMVFMGFVGLFMQAVQIWGMITHVHMIGKWATRGADENVSDEAPEFKVHYMREGLTT